MTHNVHEVEHEHVHGKNCGHTAIKHEGHTDYLHDGHMHSEHAGHYDEHIVAVSATNPEQCQPVTCDCGHKHCNHERVPHGDHFDYLHNGQLHHPHGDHCDNHGPVTTV